ncbi:hypothetical protein L596_011153 [Steinernema carpocapsae]|uniref:Uncharacterized protein n=1 Tax=Steinernema carpocapsae TaxID=34508 RepID=A0A4U5NTG5_STECR|nr:hypothetical protein L596_011153 [Steinernema carpocapsae]
MVRRSRSVAAKGILETRRKKALKKNAELRAEMDRLKGRVNDMTSLVDALKHQKIRNNSRKSGRFTHGDPYSTNLSEFWLSKCSQDSLDSFDSNPDVHTLAEARDISQNTSASRPNRPIPILIASDGGRYRMC